MMQRHSIDSSHKTDKRGKGRFYENFDMTPEQIGKIMHVEFAIGSTHMAAGDAFASAEVNTDIKLMIQRPKPCTP